MGQVFRPVSGLTLPAPLVHSRHGFAVSRSQASAGALGRGSIGSSSTVQVVVDSQAGRKVSWFTLCNRPFHARYHSDHPQSNSIHPTKSNMHKFVIYN